MKFEYKQFMQAFNLLDGRLYINRSNSYSIVVCGGAALNAMRLVIRTTKDVDILSLIDSDNNLSDPEPLPDELLTAAIETANSLGLPNDWLNNGPSSGDGGIFRMGLPDGLVKRLRLGYDGKKLKVYLISRYDQIHLKLYAAIDQFGGHHATDLKRLKPTEEELLQAIQWTFTHDCSDGFRISAKKFLREFGYEQLAQNL